MRRETELERARRRRAALRALRRARLAAAEAGVELTRWEGEFLGSLDERLEAFGRAFADPAKGERGAALSALQGAKLKEIGAKARGKAPRARWASRRPSPPKSSDRGGEV